MDAQGADRLKSIDFLSAALDPAPLPRQWKTSPLLAALLDRNTAPSAGLPHYGQGKAADQVIFGVQNKFEAY